MSHADQFDEGHRQGHVSQLWDVWDITECHVTLLWPIINACLHIQPIAHTYAWHGRGLSHRRIQGCKVCRGTSGLECNFAHFVDFRSFCYTLLWIKLHQNVPFPAENSKILRERLSSLNPFQAHPFYHPTLRLRVRWECWRGVPGVLVRAVVVQRVSSLLASDAVLGASAAGVWVWETLVNDVP